MAASLLALALMGGSLPAASAAPGDPLNPQPNGSEGGLFMFNSSGTLIDDPTYVFARAEPLFGSGSETQLMAPILGTTGATAGSTETYTFVASAANVRASGKNSWEAWATASTPEGGVIAPTLTVSSQHEVNGNGLGGVFADVGGTYYLGVAFTKNSGVTVDSTLYRTMHILAGNRFTLDPVEREVAQPATEQPPASGSTGTEPSGEASISTFEAASEDPPSETFELIMPAAGTIDLGEARRSASTAHSVALGQFTVIADRSDEPGWELHVSANDFVSGDHRIAATALGYSPIGLGELPDGISLGTAKTAGTGAFGPIITGAASSKTTVAGVDLNLNFTFTPPSDAVAGTYSSTVLLDLVSN